MKFKEYDKVKTLVEIDGYSTAPIGIIVSFYPNSDYCEVELWNADGDLVNVVIYETKELNFKDTCLSII